MIRRVPWSLSEDERLMSGLICISSTVLIVLKSPVTLLKVGPWAYRNVPVTGTSAHIIEHLSFGQISPSNGASSLAMVGLAVLNGMLGPTHLT